MRAPFLAAVLIWGVNPGPASADTLHLRAGKALKIEALSCDGSACVATLRGGDVEVRAIDVERVEPDEEVDAEPAPALVSPGGVVDSAPRTIEQMVADAARRYALPRSLVRAVARAESALNPTAVSPKGAQGVMQLMPGTARELGVENALDPAQNIDAGARLLRHLLEKYEGRVAEFNGYIVAIAQENDLPVWNFWRALQGLPNQGLGSDGVHPSVAPDAADFTPANLQYGNTVRNLTALQLLDALWRGVMQ